MQGCKSPTPKPQGRTTPQKHLGSGVLQGTIRGLYCNCTVSVFPLCTGVSCTLPQVPISKTLFDNFLRANLCFQICFLGSSAYGYGSTWGGWGGHSLVVEVDINHEIENIVSLSSEKRHIIYGSGRSDLFCLGYSRGHVRSVLQKR